MKKVKADGIFGGRNKVFFDNEGINMKILFQVIKSQQRRREEKKFQKDNKKSYRKMKIEH